MSTKFAILSATLICFLIAVLFKSAPTNRTRDGGPLALALQAGILLVFAGMAYWIFAHWVNLGR